MTAGVIYLTADQNSLTLHNLQIFKSSTVISWTETMVLLKWKKTYALTETWCQPFHCWNIQFVLSHIILKIFLLAFKNVVDHELKNVYPLLYPFDFNICDKTFIPYIMYH